MNMQDNVPADVLAVFQSPRGQELVTEAAIAAVLKHGSLLSNALTATKGSSVPLVLKHGSLLSNALEHLAETLADVLKREFGARHPGVDFAKAAKLAVAELSEVLRKDA